ncbi:hypothetical protein NDU88_003692 [Pleurodeles waltl]|uniref:Uncharacterized protein n=1 Tax=Pleurodeles waltl TaxID=8319 RepID=A0AAV7QAF2_PLEWA|nr:hypothetical protein NDU88_003692 [Pleurodeles waltl]
MLVERLLINRIATILTLRMHREAESRMYAAILWKTGRARTPAGAFRWPVALFALCAADGGRGPAPSYAFHAVTGCGIGEVLCGCLRGCPPAAVLRTAPPRLRTAFPGLECRQWLLVQEE